MLVNLTLSDFLIAITGFLTHFSPKYDTACACNIFLSLVGYWSSAFWSSATNILLYKKIAKAGGFNSGNFYQQSIYAWIGSCLFVPLILTLVVFNIIELHYAPSANRFEKRVSNSQNFIAFLLVEAIPFTFSILVSFVSSFKQIKILKELDVFHLMDISTFKLLRYPIAQCLVFLPSLICKTWYFQVPFTSKFFTAIRLFGYDLAGFIDSLVYRTQGFSIERSKKASFANKVFSHSFETTSRSSFSDECAYDEEEYYYREA